MNNKNIFSSLFLLILGALLFYIAANVFYTTPMLQIGADGKLPDGSRYYGKMSNGLFNGKGTLVWGNGDKYSGGFKDGKMSGEGELKLHGGGVYVGEFQSGMMQGQGKYTESSGIVYEGSFISDTFTGKGNIINVSEDYHYKGEVADWMMHGRGLYKMSNGAIYEGEFVEDSFTGQGTYTDEKKSQYTGTFKDWSLQGNGHYKGADGALYTGGFKDSTYQGKGEYIYANGDVYTGEFDYGLFNGTGYMAYAKPKNNISEQSGEWKYGQWQNPEHNKRHQRAGVRAETLLYVEQERLDRALALVDSGINNKSDLFFIGVGGDGSQQVFKKEVEYTADKINQLYGTSGHSLKLVNTYIETTEDPLATRKSLQQSLKNIAEKMEVEQDILMLYITSHGSDKFDISLQQLGFKFPDVNVMEIKHMLDETKIKWKIIIVSACYSGGFIPVFEDKNTLVITASDSKSQSFGCTDDADLTWFARAFVRDALQPGVSFVDAFDKARGLIKQWEKEEGHKNPSNPQISMGSKIEQQLSRL